MTMLKLIVLVAFCSYVQGLFLNDPCDVFPEIRGIPKDPDFTVDTQVPPQCMNGTFRWDYPKGHVRLHFSNPKHLATILCIRDSLGGTFFNITDVTTHAERQIGTFTYDKSACTGSDMAKDIIMRVDAPEDLRYMGEVAYFVKHV